MNRFLLVLICIGTLHQAVIAQTNGNALDPEHTVGTAESARKIKEAKSDKPPETNKLPPPEHKVYKKSVLPKRKTSK